MLAVIYARYSDSKQTEQSIEGQLEVCYKYAQDNGYTVINEYIDRAQTGRTDDRYQFQKMIKDTAKKIFDTIIVYQFDRFARNRYDSAIYKKALKDNGVTLLSAREIISDDASGVLSEAILEGMAEYYSIELSQKVNRGMEINAEKCKSNGGTTPLGYRIEDHHYVIDEEKVPIVREIFEKYARGLNITQICDSLNERQIQTAHGAKFNKNSLHTILKNKKYLGIYIYKDIEIPGGMPRIIDDALFQKVQDKMELNKKAPARARAKAEYLLTTKLFCGYCKEMMVGHSSNQISTKGVIYNYYKCKNSGGGKPCKKKMVMKDYIEDVVVNECRKLLTPKNIKRIAKEITKISQSMEDDTELKRLEKLLQKAKISKDNQMASMRLCTDNTVREMLFEDLGKIGTEIKELEHQIQIEKARHYVIPEEKVIEKLEQLAKGNANNIAYRRTLIKLFVNRIYLYDDKFTITFTTGDDNVTISDILLEKIEKGTSAGNSEKLCLLNGVVHQPQTLENTTFSRVFPFSSIQCYAICVAQNRTTLCDAPRILTHKHARSIVK